MVGWLVRAFRLGLVATVAVASFAPVNAGAFTLIGGVTKLFITPSFGYPTAPLKVLGTWSAQTSCQPSPGPVTFRFNFDSTEIWAINVNVCDPNTFVWTTAWSPGIKPPGPPAPGPHTITV